MLAGVSSAVARKLWLRAFSFQPVFLRCAGANSYISVGDFGRDVGGSCTFLEFTNYSHRKLAPQSHRSRLAGHPVLGDDDWGSILPAISNCTIATNLV